MTGRDLLDAIGYVDESLLERCQKTEQIAEKKKISWFGYRKKCVSLAACLSLLIVSILGFTYWQYNFTVVGEILAHKVTEGIIASTNALHSEETEFLPKPDAKDEADSAQAGNISNGTGSDTAEDTLNGTDQELASDSISGTSNEDYQADSVILPDSDTYSGTKNNVDTTKDSEHTDISSSPDTKTTKADETDKGLPNYSQGIKIETVKEIPKGNLPSGDTIPPSEDIIQPGGVLQPDDIPSVKEILAENTVIIRGTVKKIQHYHANGGQIDVYFSVISMKVKEVYRADGKGNPQKGKICKIYLPKASVYPGSILKRFTKGSEVIIMPYIADTKTGIHKKGKFFAFLDVSDYYFKAKTAESHVFLKTKTNILYDTRIYDIPYTGEKVMLDDIGEYLRKMLKK